jgi:hypothetical protein
MVYRPAVSLIPRPLWQANLRKILTRTQWKKIRSEALEKRGCRCETCGKEEPESKRISAHEEWDYDTSKSPAVAKLTGIKLSCWHCHAVEHFGAVISMTQNGELGEKAIEDTIAHFCRLNSVNRETFEAHALDALDRYGELSKLKWRVDWGPFASLVESRLAD